MADRIKKTPSQAMQKLVADSGMTYEEVLEACITDGTCWAICMNLTCDYTTEMEPDQERGWCEGCNANTVVSAAILAGVI